MLLAVILRSSMIFGSIVSESVVPCGQVLRTSASQDMKWRRLSWRQPRIVGGSPVTKGQIPWQVAVRKDDQQVCGGALISPNFVVTTAHCFRRKGRYELSSGIVDVNDMGQLRTINRTILHPSWRYGVWENDIALLRVNESFRFDAFSAPLCLPSVGAQSVDRIIVSGWGRLKEGYRQSPVLHKVTLETASDDDCEKRFPYAFSSRTMFCALSENKDACQGDSGSAAFNIDEGSAMLVGLVSWGRGCARNNTPGVYTKVPSFLAWIKETVHIHGDDVDRAQLAMQSGVEK